MKVSPNTGAMTLAVAIAILMPDTPARGEPFHVTENRDRVSGEQPDVIPLGKESTASERVTERDAGRAIEEVIVTAQK